VILFYIVGVSLSNGIFNLVHWNSGGNWGWSWLLGAPIGALVAALWLMLRRRRQSRNAQ
jgi:phosphate/sulfate permease